MNCNWKLSLSLTDTTRSNCHVINQMRRLNPISIVACMLVFLSLQLGQDIFVSELHRVERVKEVWETCFNSSNLNVIIFLLYIYYSFV